MLGWSLFKHVSYSQPLVSETFPLNFLTKKRKIVLCVCKLALFLQPPASASPNPQLLPFSVRGHSLCRRDQLLECMPSVDPLECKAAVPPLFGLDGWPLGMWVASFSCCAFALHLCCESVWGKGLWWGRAVGRRSALGLSEVSGKLVTWSKKYISSLPPYTGVFLGSAPKLAAEHVIYL